MSVKRDTTTANVWALPMIYVVTTAAGAYYNAQQVGILKSPDFFNVPQSEIGRTQSKIMFWGLLISCFFSFFVGALFDICGRKPVLTVAYAVLVSVILTMPYVPTINWLIVNRIGLTIAIQFLHAHPLVIDYVKSESRGKANAAQNVGNLIGEAFAMIVLIQIQISLAI